MYLISFEFYACFHHLAMSESIGGLIFSSAFLLWTRFKIQSFKLHLIDFFTGWNQIRSADCRYGGRPPGIMQ